MKNPGSWDFLTVNIIESIGLEHFWNTNAHGWVPDKRNKIHPSFVCTWGWMIIKWRNIYNELHRWIRYNGQTNINARPFEIQILSKFFGILKNEILRQVNKNPVNLIMFQTENDVNRKFFGMKKANSCPRNVQTKRRTDQVGWKEHCKSPAPMWVCHQNISRWTMKQEFRRKPRSNSKVCHSPRRVEV